MKRYNDHQSFDNYDRWVLGLPQQTPEKIWDLDDEVLDHDIDYDGDDYDINYEEDFG